MQNKGYTEATADALLFCQGMILWNSDIQLYLQIALTVQRLILGALMKDCQLVYMVPKAMDQSLVAVLKFGGQGLPRQPLLQGRHEFVDWKRGAGTDTHSSQ